MRSFPKSEFDAVLERALDYAKGRGYVGYNKHDGLASPLLRAISFERKWLRILAIQSVMRLPWNVRPLLSVRKVRNPKGEALFARSHLHSYRRTGSRSHLDEACRLLDGLLESADRRFGEVAWGYQYPWQDLGFFAPAGFPNRIVTYFVGRALIDGFEVLGEKRYLEGAVSAVTFLLDAPGILKSTDEILCVGYLPDPKMEMVVMDVSVLAGALAAIVGRLAGIPRFLKDARRLVAYVASRQTPAGAWHYTDPPGQGPISHDNYHTGEIVDAFKEYRLASGDDTFEEVYRRGLAFYRERLFTEDSRPKWMHDKTYPHDAHGYAQGIITFTLAGDLSFARAVLQAALDDLFIPEEARLAYQRGRFLSKRYTLMRWSQAWLCFAMAYHLDGSLLG